MEPGSAIDPASLQSGQRRINPTSYPIIPLRSGPYTASYLPRQSRSIRVLHLEGLPHDPESLRGQETPLAGQLTVQSLDESPDYTALSYVWAQAEWKERRVINVQEAGVTIGELEISENCYQALIKIRRRAGSISLWIDAICINQADDGEKCHQVALMGDIYGLAKMTYVWLGEGHAGTDKAMRYIRAHGLRSTRLQLGLAAATTEQARRKERIRYNALFFRDILERCKTFPWAFTWRFYWKASRGWILDNHRPNGWLYSLRPAWYIEKQDLDFILDTVWLTRAWTFQEFVLSRDITLLCGNEEIHWEEFFAALWLLPGPTHWRVLARMWLRYPRIVPTREEDALGTPRCRLPMKAVLYLILLILLPIPLAAILFRPTQDVLRLIYLIVALLVIYYHVVSLLYTTVIIPLLTGSRLQMMSSTSMGGDESYGWLLNTIRRTLLDRSCSVPQDKYFSLYGVLERYGVLLQVPDLAQDPAEISIAYFRSLIAWDSQFLALLVDAAGTDAHACDASWAPTWSRPKPRLWLPPTLKLSQVPIPPLSTAVELSGNACLRVAGKWLGKVQRCEAFDTGQRLGREPTNAELRAMLRSFTTFLLQLAQYTGGFHVGEFLSTVMLPKESLEPKTDFTGSAFGRYLDLPGRRDRRLNVWFDLIIAIQNCLKKINTTNGTPISEYIDQLLSLLDGVDTSGKLLDGFRTLIRALNDEERVIVITERGLPATGSNDIAEGDEIVHIAGVPTLMALRRRAGVGRWIVVGPLSGPYEQQGPYQDGELEQIDIY